MRIASGISFFLLLLATEAGAEPLRLFERLPDITSGFVKTTYVASSGEFNAEGIAVALDIDGSSPPHFITNGIFNIEMRVDPFGSPLSGRLSIIGDIPNLSASGTLLEGDLLEFGFENDGGEIFEFLFDGIEGELRDLFDPQVGVILDANDTGFDGDFRRSFTNTFGVSDTFTVPIPEPTSAFIWVLAVLLAGAYGCRWRMGKTTTVIAGRHNIDH